MRLAAAVLVLCLALGAGSAASQTAAPATVKVMTRNIYLGADLTPLFSARNLNEVLATAAAVWAQQQANNFPARARALAAEIATHRPDVVGLQEASIYRSDTPFDGPITPAEKVEQDYLEILLAALKARGEDYRVVATFDGTDAELPVGNPPTMDIRFTDRVSMLVRADAARRGIRLRNVVTGQYGVSLPVPVAGTTLPVRRGWVAATFMVNRRPLVVVSTHLEAFNPQVRAAQGQQLLAGVAPTQVPIVLLGDFNSGPGGDRTVYDAFRAGGFSDAWEAVHGSDPGLTCCHKDDLRDPDATLRTRIDLALFRNGVTASAAQVVGEAPTDRAGGLWPSDHAGVVATLRVP